MTWLPPAPGPQPPAHLPPPPPPCAPITADATGRVCVSVDRTSFVMMMEFGPAFEPTLPVIVRESVVHRT